MVIARWDISFWNISPRDCRHTKKKKYQLDSKSMRCVAEAIREKYQPSDESVISSVQAISQLGFQTVGVDRAIKKSRNVTQLKVLSTSGDNIDHIGCGLDQLIPGDSNIHTHTHVYVYVLGTLHSLL